VSKNLFIFHTYENAKRKFKEFLTLHDPNAIVASVSPQQLKIEMNGDTYEFTWIGDVPNKILGRTFTDIVIDEYATISPEQWSLIQSRKRAE
jgi:hypothetical protein